MSLELGWWMAPLLITIVCFWFAYDMNRGQGNSMFSYVVSFFNYAIVGGIPSLVAWLVWALWGRA